MARLFENSRFEEAGLKTVSKCIYRKGKVSKRGQESAKSCAERICDHSCRATACANRESGTGDEIKIQGLLK
jgi:hypothetical protein